MLVAAGVRVIRPWEVGIYIRLGRFIGILRPGLHWVPPFISSVHRIDLRTQVVDIPRQEVITRDNSPVVVDAIVYFRVVDPKKAFFEVEDYRMAVVALAQTTLRSVIGDMELDEILYNRAAINARLRRILDEATDKWGVRVESVEIREVEPSPTVKKAMEEQTAAERERRAAILRADGERRAAILQAEGEKQAMILRAEGERASRVLRAEGERMALILRALGEAQRLRVLTAASAAMTPQALSILAMETLQELGRGKATKIVVPYEVTRLLETLSSHIAGAAEKPQPGRTDVEALQEALQRLEQLLGPLPRSEELMSEVKRLQEEAEQLRRQSPEKLEELLKPPKELAEQPAESQEKQER
ncbi:SPFH domain-containing protein [Pyrodictium abyssi]|uniref:SPFH domain-containing protein n=1 Tax=Pyrodictium abyssi TaxID=54256 RepID=A0ABM8IXD0_9CREN|nr:SPFH domain-containing protein [Pyrodictium abyssi]